MCGIFFILEKEKLKIEEIKREFEKGKKRGPENSQLMKIEVENGYVIYMGFHRLAINGLNTESNQPIEEEDMILICNGEIYNHKELEEKYKLEMKTGSDCEVILKMCRKEGIKKTLKEIEGVYSFVLYDKKKEIIYISRDRMGVRPLYMGINSEEERVVVSSELKMISKLGLEKIVQYKPSHYTKIKLKEKNKMKTKRYYDIYNIKETILKTKEEEIYKRVSEGLVESVRKRIHNTERKIACLLSGGLDSSLIASLVVELSRREGKEKEIETYCIGLEGSPDIKYAEKVAEFIGTKHKSIIVSEEEFLKAIPEVIYALESYDTTTVRASVGNYLVAKYISENSEAKVIFNGDGSDELCGGYLYFNNIKEGKKFNEECLRLLNDIYYFDVQRSDKSIASNGLEARTPFLDTKFIEKYLSVNIKNRCHTLKDKPEKWLLRKSMEYWGEKNEAHNKKGILPKEILYRTKEAFSDGVSDEKKSWHKIIEKKCEKMLLFDTLNKINEPKTREQKYYRNIFNKYYGYKYDELIPYFWMPRYVKTDDPSARSLKIYKKNNTNIEEKEEKEEK